MQFLAQVVLDDLGDGAEGRGILAMFACQNDPGMCGDWEPDSGGNQAFLFPGEDLVPLPQPADADETLLQLGSVRTVSLVQVDESDYDLAGEEWASREDRRKDGGHRAEGKRHVLCSAHEVVESELGGLADGLCVEEQQKASDAGGDVEVVAMEKASDERPSTVVADHGNGDITAGAADDDVAGVAVRNRPGQKSASDVQCR
jgi:hypothetical protein